MDENLGEARDHLPPTSLDGRIWRHVEMDGIGDHRVSALEGPCDVPVDCA
jgi:hypothetical protein